MNASTFFSAYIKELTAPRNDFFNKNEALIIKAAKNCAIKLATGGKIFIVADFLCYPIAACLHQHLLHPIQQERPPLPAILLGANFAALSQATYDAEFIYSQQLEILGTEKKDVLISFFIQNSCFLSDFFSSIVQNMEFLWINICKESSDYDSTSQIVLPDIKSVYILQEMALAFANIFCRFLDFFLFEEPGELLPHLQSEENNANL